MFEKYDRVVRGWPLLGVHWFISGPTLFNPLGTELWAFLKATVYPDTQLITWKLYNNTLKSTWPITVTSNTDALERLKYKVNYALELL
ncbi:hypothetical protein GCM10028809_43310 [Spirosoma gilvum]